MAFPLKDKLQKEYEKIVGNEFYKYYNPATWWNFNLKIEDSSWSGIDYVSVDGNENIIGYMRAEISRNDNKVSSLAILNFKNKSNITYSKDLYQFLTELFTKYCFRKIEFSVVVGNPIEKMYDKYIQKYGGKIVGKYSEYVTLQDGNCCDFKLYEIFRTEFLKNA